MGRRGVQQLTPAEWREALEQQIREKERQKQENKGIDGDGEDQLRRRSQSAPQQGEGEGELISSIPGLARVVTTATVDGEMERNTVAGRRRYFKQQSQDEYLKGLREQIEENKRLAQLEQEKYQSRRRFLSRSEEDGDVGNRWKICEDKCVEEKDCSRTDSPSHDQEKNSMSIPTSNQDEAQTYEATVPKSDVAADPVVITKIVDFCEELKKQNEDVKRQLSEQHAVLTSLHSTLSVEANTKDVVARRGSVRKSQLKTRPVETPTASRKSKSQTKGSDPKAAITTPVIRRPRPTRGETKIPLPRNRVGSSLRSAGVDIAKGFLPEASTQAHPELLKAEAKNDNSTCADEIPAEIKVVPPDSPKNLPKELESQLCEISAGIQDSKKNEENKETATKRYQEEREENRSAKDDLMECSSAFVSTDDRHVMRTRRGDDEQPMDTESKFIHNWGDRSTRDELLECESISILDGPSSLVALDQSFTDLFH
ncbi:hypothetical protein DVH05_002837 [Phytophthora capsici]|nr:hypothetical protein DVH05_002837 [Phytophthora capsici]